MTRPELEKLVETHVLALREHVDSVRIFVTLDSDDGLSETIAVDCGRGNMYAQLGQVREFCDYMEELTRLEAKKSEED
jgi:hypothetical protein